MRIIKQAALVGVVTFATASAFSALVLAQPGAQDGRRGHGKSGEAHGHKGVHGKHKGHAKSEHLAQLKTELGLSDAQVQALQAARAEAQQARAQGEGAAESWQSMRRAFESILTPEQLATFETLKVNMKERHAAKKVERLTAALEQTPQQQTQVREIITAKFQDRGERGAEGNREAWQAKRAAVREEIRAVLTDAQRQRFDAMKREGRKNKWQQGSSA